MEERTYKFPELSETAKQVVMQRFGDDDFEHAARQVCEDADRMAAILGISISTRDVKLRNGKTRQEPCIHYQGFDSQGDGASFDGHYRYQKGAGQAISGETDDPELQRIADHLEALQFGNDFQLRATISSGRNSNCISVDLEWDDDVPTGDGIPTKETWDDLAQLMNDFADWVFSRLQEEYEYVTSEEYVAESCEANDYVFDEEGNLQ